MTEKQKYLQWFCGFYEGEGSISNDKSNNNRLRLSIAQNDKTPLEIALKIWGGTIQKRVRKSPASDKICTGYEWRLCHNDAIVFINDIRPLMLIPYKIGQIDKALELMKEGYKCRYKCKNCECDFASPSGRTRHFKTFHQNTDTSFVVKTAEQDIQIAGNP
jgi:hypothetical protein